MNGDLFAPLARILLRYVGGALIAKGILHIDPAALMDPDMVTVVSVLLGVGFSSISEGWYMLARRRGWGR